MYQHPDGILAGTAGPKMQQLEGDAGGDQQHGRSHEVDDDHGNG